MTFIPITHTNPSYGPADLRLTVASDSAANVTITGPGGNINISLAAGSSETRIIGNNNQIATYNTPFAGSWHITSDRAIWVYALNSMQNPSKSCESATILPTTALDTAYIVQDYPPFIHGSSVAFVAVEDNTILTMVVPCDVRNTTLNPGDTLTVTLQSGQAYNLYGNSSTVGFAGMRVTSNGKPFAMYHGAISTRVPNNATDGGDLTFEQALPIKDWGTDFIVPGMSFMSGNSHIRITAAEDNTTISINGAPVPSVLNAGWSHEHSMPTSNNCHITADKPVSVILYMACHTVAGYKGDPAAITIPPINRGVCKTMFRVDNIGTVNSNYLSVICPTAINGSVQLDGAYLSTGATIIDGYTVYRLSVSAGHHSLACNDGPFVAFLYGFGPWEGYAHPLGFRFDAPIQIHDTIRIFDTVCQGEAYYQPLMDLTITANQTSNPGIFEFRTDSVQSGTIVHHFVLTLTVLPSASTSISHTIALGDTLFYNGDTLTASGSYVFTLTAANGCDSVVTINLSYLSDTVHLYDTVCQGYRYSRNGFTVDNPQHGTTLERDTVENGIPFHYMLHLTVLPSSAACWATHSTSPTRPSPTRVPTPSSIPPPTDATRW